MLLKVSFFIFSSYRKDYISRENNNYSWLLQADEMYFSTFNVRKIRGS